MRVLFTVCADRSLFYSMAPLAWALRTAGHDVRVASQPNLAATVTQAGLTAVPLGRDHAIWRALAHDPGKRREVRAGLLPPYDVVERPDVTWEHLVEGYRQQVTWWHKAENFPLVDQLVDFARWWRPDLVVWEPVSYAGAIAAAAAGAAHGRLLWSLDVFGATRREFLRRKADGGHAEDPLRDWLAAHAAKHGVAFSEELVTGQFTVDQFPPSLRLPSPPTGDEPLSMRYTPYGGPAVVPAWLRTPPSRPRVALTFGITATGQYDGYAVNLRAILDALSDVDVDVVATVADAERDGLGRAPDNARLVPYVPLHALAPTCAAVVHHAGPGTLATTSLHAVPQLALPWDFDEPALAARLAAQGAGLVLDPRAATGATVRDAVLRLLDDPALRTGAGTLRDGMLAMPTPNELVPRLEELTTGR
ncbi:activator-dependent family glycosyltransferase [Saccharothrix australiensis]|uniref:Glycosyltransferase (Activator-dependent family) n=1 Tax=Saccharothrix australiensis TaxID=2072 RepID=A0A495W1V0_9PSEU|nr:activator-dependent family glycosyltransferase [Saccharothrix australiensis]RKT54693.1 glycosyltransferase (activator-dependent family) [Saccharothrix australiensis]